MVMQGNAWREIPLFNKVKTRISVFALKIAHHQYKKMIDHSGVDAEPLPGCRNLLKKTMGIPCAHPMDLLHGFQQKLKLNDFHKQWHTEYTPIVQQDALPLAVYPESPVLDHPHFRGEDLAAYQSEAAAQYQEQLELYHRQVEEEERRPRMATGPVDRTEQLFSFENVEKWKDVYVITF